MKRMLVLLGALLVSGPVLAEGDPAARESQAHYARGKTAYDLGRFDEAVLEFERAYEIKPNPALIFNLAQAHKQRGDAARAVFYYRRYLSLAPETPNRASIEQRIEELSRADAEPGVPAQGDAIVAEDRRTRARFGAAAGPVLVNLGEGPEVPTQPSLFIEGAFGLRLPGFELELGAGFGAMPLPYSFAMTERKTALLTSALAQVGVRRKIRPDLWVRAQLGGGVQALTGLRSGNPFVEGAQASTGLFMPQLRLAAGFDIELRDGFLLTVIPFAFSISPGPSALDEHIARIVRFDLLAGVAYSR
jgi:hypothetical protein